VASFTFKDTDMADYGLTVKSVSLPVRFDTKSVNLPYKEYALATQKKAKPIELDVVIEGDSLADLKSNLDSIKAVLNTRLDGKLELDLHTDRYWMVRFNRMDPNPGHRGTLIWKGQISFTAFDPAAYNNTEADSTHTIDANPKEVTETIGGTAQTYPTWELTADAAITDETIEVENITTGEKIEWTGSLAIDDVLLIDSDTMYVTKNDVASMATISGQFPTLAVGENEIAVREFSGTLKITYRARYI
jgi:phage-related protein